MPSMRSRYEIQRLGDENRRTLTTPPAGRPETYFHETSTLVLGSGAPPSPS